ncbi:FG-GAP repeat domain-containing protein [Streptomyces sp. NPDC058664]|uniref:FG-GAP repeat domain-containing protein n=1 Tax=unclassified Streptomyces TaxID=2593676 RepID=UPI003654CF01
MSTARASRYRLTTAVAVALAVTAGAAATGAAPVAMATTGSVTAAGSQSTEQDVLPFPAEDQITGAGPSGFLSARRGADFQTFTYRWTRYADGVTTTLPEGAYTSSRRTDIVTRIDGTVHSLYDMATGADPVVIDLGLLGEGYGHARSAGSSLVVTKANATGGRDLHVVGKPQGELVDHKVTGLPEDATFVHLDLDSPDTVVAVYTRPGDGATPTRHVAVVDLATHAVVETYASQEITNGALNSRFYSTALSATHVAWVEWPVTSPQSLAPTLVAVRRDTGETTRVPLGTTYREIQVELVGDWLTYGMPGGYHGTGDPLYALTALSLKDGTRVKLLDTFESATTGPYGTQVVRGGTLAEGEGLYRISVGEDGTPAATLVASTGEPTALELYDQKVPEVIDLDTASVPIPLSWTFSRRSVGVRVELTHTATGTKVPLPGSDGGWTRTVGWNSMSGTGRDAVPAYNGEYTWRMTATPANRVGPPVERTGTFKVVRKTVAHDFNDNGTPDLLVRDSGGLKLHNTSQPLGSWGSGTPELLGTGGWNAYDRLVSPGDVAGAPHADIVARDRTGVLWLHEGTGHALAPRVRVGGGWGAYQQITGGSDLNGDGRSDLLGTDASGALWLHKGTGSAITPFAARVKVGGGWGVYNQLTATGQIGGGPAGDLVARDTAGVLWLYLGKGDGTFAPRTRIGSGWNAYEGLVGFGDVDRDGHADLLANDAGSTYYYKGTGNWRAPFEARRSVYGYDTLGRDATVF